MKKILFIFAFAPVIGLAYSSEDLDEIDLVYNPTETAYNIVYRMDDGQTAMSNFTAAAGSRYHAYNRLYNVTKNSPGFEDTTQSDVERLFDYDVFDAHRVLVRSLIDAVRDSLQAADEVDVQTVLELTLWRENI